MRAALTLLGSYVVIGSTAAAFVALAFGLVWRNR